ncbi:alpha-L-fucosidase [Verrucomicrobiota bacterium]
MKTPAYLAGYAKQYASDPRTAALQWFRDARYGLFLHYGLYSLLGRHEWVQYREHIRPADYALLKDYFRADKFDAGGIADLAVDAGMRYVNITTRHHDSFCLWDTDQTSFKTTSSPCGRDLVGELAEACAERGLGLCLYYSHGRDWRHPHAPNNDRYGGAARPEYDPPEPAYAVGEAHDLGIYLGFMERQITELLSNYGPIAAIWLDGVATPRSGDVEAFRLQELYDMIHSLQPQVLLSYKNGLTGTEDFYAPEENWKDIDALSGKPCEICGCMSGGWGYTAGTPHRGPEEVWAFLAHTRQRQANLLLNTGPLPDGGIDPTDEATLRAVGARLREQGFPSPGSDLNGTKVRPVLDDGERSLEKPPALRRGSLGCEATTQALHPILPRFPVRARASRETGEVFGVA